MIYFCLHFDYFRPRNLWNMRIRLTKNSQKRTKTIDVINVSYESNLNVGKVKKWWEIISFVSYISYESYIIVGKVKKWWEMISFVSYISYEIYIFVGNVKKWWEIFSYVSYISYESIISWEM